MALKFVKHASFPQNKCSYTAAGYFWKMQVREWAFAQVDLEGAGPGIDVTSNNPNVVLGVHEKGEKGIKSSSSGANKLTVRFYAKGQGFTFVHPFRSDPFVAEEDVRMQVEVVKREATSVNSISVTDLKGSTIALLAHDAKAYEMDKTFVFPSTAVNPLSFFSAVPADTNHVVI
jgi:hypothetical protein